MTPHLPTKTLKNLVLLSDKRPSMPDHQIPPGLVTFAALAHHLSSLESLHIDINYLDPISPPNTQLPAALQHMPLLSQVDIQLAGGPMDADGCGAGTPSSFSVSRV